eukprot:2248144-Karenia_brevis.AAC.1
MFGFAKGESEHALTRLFHALEFVCEEYLNLPRIYQYVKAVYSDRAPAIPRIISRFCIEGVRHVVCLQHIKKNVNSQRKLLPPGLQNKRLVMRTLRRWIEISAFVPGILFGYLWTLFLGRLQEQGANALADY